MKYMKYILLTLLMLIAPAHADYSQGADPAYALSGGLEITTYTAAPDGKWVLLTAPDSRPTTPMGLFGDELNGLNYGSKWVIFTYDGTRYRLAKPYDKIPPGTGFWFIQYSGSSISVSHSGTRISGKMTKLLKPGWNLVGAPNNALTSVSPNLTAYSFNTGTGQYERQDDGTLFRPFQGYWVYNPSGTQLMTFTPR